MKVEASAGGFKASTYTDGSPYWVELSYQGMKIPTNFKSDELHDLKHVVDHLIRQLEAHHESRIALRST